ncbi:MmcQ/YjbR family DNA-binding protein [Nocardioides nanhaiensis]|uniref:MmcQ/YjbR family DNA-binding protein n=1 Tax=Nocardioides nanhaiensis TaxID=1476871 RepID=A0ABP8X1W2_9ACTN
MGTEIDVAEALRRVGAVALALPEVVEEDAWVGVRWRVRGRTFAQVLEVVDGRPPGLGTPLSPAPGERPVVLHFHAAPEDVLTLRHVGPPWFKTLWGPSSMLLRLPPEPDWGEVAEVVVDSFRVLAPRYLAARLP